MAEESASAGMPMEVEDGVEVENVRERDILDEEDDGNVSEKDLLPIYGMLSEVDASATMDPTLAGAILRMVKQGVVKKTAENSCVYANLRGSEKVRVSDFQAHSERALGIHVPGFGTLPTPSGMYGAEEAAKAHDTRHAYHPDPDIAEL